MPTGIHLVASHRTGPAAAEPLYRDGKAPAAWLPLAAMSIVKHLSVTLADFVASSMPTLLPLLSGYSRMPKESESWSLAHITCAMGSSLRASSNSPVPSISEG